MTADEAIAIVKNEPYMLVFNGVEVAKTLVAEVERLRAEKERLRERLSNQTKQTTETYNQIHERVVEKLMLFGAIPDGIDPNGHPIEQVVGTCLASLVGGGK